jgi:nucleoside-diphosphate-sugar epimerase
MKLVVIGLGFTASAFVAFARERFSHVTGTTRKPERAQRLAEDLKADILLFDGLTASADLKNAVLAADALLVSAGPNENGDPTLNAMRQTILAAPRLAWIGYLSTVGVYGDHGGAWIDETTPVNPGEERTRRRVVVEQAWLELGRHSGKPVQVFRLGGIYGPGRSQIEDLIEGTARRIHKPGQVFNRIHADDIARVLLASLDRPEPGAVYNVVDDEPAPPQDVVTYCAALLGVEPPPLIPFEDAPLTPMGRSFYSSNRRIRNTKIKSIGASLAYPTYREGLRAIYEEHIKPGMDASG